MGDAKKDDHKEDDYYNYCMKYDKYADKCNADDKCYFYTAKDGDKDKTDDKKPGDGDKKDEHKDKPGYGEYKRGTGCYSKKMLKKDRRLGGHGDHSKSDHKGSDHSKDAKKDDHKEDDYCMKYDKY